MTKVDLKIVLLGQQHVGKSCLVDRCVPEHPSLDTIQPAFVPLVPLRSLTMRQCLHAGYPTFPTLGLSPNVALGLSPNVDVRKSPASAVLLDSYPPTGTCHRGHSVAVAHPTRLPAV